MSTRMTPTGASTLDGRPSTLLDDGTFHVELAIGHPAGNEPGCLTVRVDSDTSDCIGAFGSEAGGLDDRWSAWITVPFDDASNSDSMIVARDVGRLEAVVALWRARRLAHRPAQ